MSNALEINTMIYNSLNTDKVDEPDKIAIILCNFHWNHDHSFGDAYKEIKTLTNSLNVILLFCTLYSNIKFHRPKVILQVFNSAAICETNNMHPKDFVKKGDRLTYE